MAWPKGDYERQWVFCARPGASSLHDDHLADLRRLTGGRRPLVRLFRPWVRAFPPPVALSRPPHCLAAGVARAVTSAGQQNARPHRRGKAPPSLEGRSAQRKKPARGPVCFWECGTWVPLSKAATCRRTPKNLRKEKSPRAGRGLVCEGKRQPQARCFSAACAAARRAIGTRKGEQLT